jgi:hypothetical protein
VKAAAVFVVRRFQDFGMERPAACATVAKHLEALGVKSERGPGHVTQRTVREWCEAINADVGRHSFTSVMYHKLMTTSPYRELPPSSEAKQLLLTWLEFCSKRFQAKAS